MMGLPMVDNYVNDHTLKTGVVVSSLKSLILSLTLMIFFHSSLNNKNFLTILHFTPLGVIIKSIKSVP